jgi:hypothetical protein
MELVRLYSQSTDLTHANRFEEATRTLGDALAAWKAKAFEESPMAILQPLMSLADLYRTLALEAVRFNPSVFLFYFIFFPLFFSLS